MKLNALPLISARWIFATCLAGALFTVRFQAQETQQSPPPSQPEESQPRVQETQPPADTQPAPQAQSKDAREEIQINELTRTYVVHLPQGYSSQQHYPVVILLHGSNQDAGQMARLTHFNQLADLDGIIAVYPNAANGRWNLGAGGEARPYRQGRYRRYPPPGQRREPNGEGRPQNMDMEFLHRMLDKVASHYTVDTRRIYAVGLGEGGFLALRMGCTAADRIAAVAAVGAAVPRTLSCVPSRPISALLMNGTDDPIVPYNGGRYKGGMVHLLSAEDSAKEWARINHCSDKPSESKLPALQERGKETKVYLFNNCQEGAQVALYEVKGGGHTWPGGEQYMSEKEVGKTSNALNANETVWSFLVTKKISGETGVER
jgi:polyhydroxybutyrate depolymerase